MTTTAEVSVGRVAGIWRYPVKSMAPEPLPRAEVSWHGLAGDRRWALIQNQLVKSGFPWLTIRELPTLGHYRPVLVDPSRPDKSPTYVDTPDGCRFEITDPALAAHIGRDVRIIKQDRGIFDALPLSLLTTTTVSSLSAAVGLDLEVERFRPNILVEPVGGRDPFPEDAWVGKTLQLGAMQMRLDQRDRRCVVVNVDPATGARDASILQAIGRERDACLGVYGSTVRPGPIAVGDPVWVLDEPHR